jgi:hypothetical protein
VPLLREIDAEESDRTAGGFEQTEQHRDGRGLARAVTTEQGHRLAALHGETDSVHRLDRAEVLHQAFDGDDFGSGFGRHGLGRKEGIRTRGVGLANSVLCATLPHSLNRSAAGLQKRRLRALFHTWKPR